MNVFIEFKTIVKNHAHMYADGNVVYARTSDGSTASFPIDRYGRANVWTEAVEWARYQRGCETMELRGVPSDLSERINEYVESRPTAKAAMLDFA